MKDKIEKTLHQWLLKNIKSYQIIAIATDELNATKTTRYTGNIEYLEN